MEQFQENTEVREEIDDGESDVGINNNISEERKIFLRTFVHFVQPNMQLYVKKTKEYSKAAEKAQTWAVLGAAMSPPMSGAYGMRAESSNS